jgi:hypothetical protein
MLSEKSKDKKCPFLFSRDSLGSISNIFLFGLSSSVHLELDELPTLGNLNRIWAANQENTCWTVFAIIYRNYTALAFCYHRDSRRVDRQVIFTVATSEGAE